MAFPFEKAFRDISRGDEAAYLFLLTFLAWMHSLDDLIDQDQPINLDVVLNTHFCLLSMFAENAFFRQHREKFIPLFLAGTMAYLESERFKKKEEVLLRITSQVLKSQYQDIFYYVAYLTGGFQHMMSMSRAYRDYDFDPAPPPVPLQPPAPQI